MENQATNLEFEEVEAGGWAKFTQQGDMVEGIFQEYFIKPAVDQFAEQIVAVLVNDGSTTNVGLPSKNAKYLNSIRALKPGHRVRISLTGYYDQDKATIVPNPGKTKKGTSFAKNYSIQMSKTPDPSYNAPASDEITIEDLPF